MFLKLLRPKVTRRFVPPGERYLCQFKMQDQEAFTSDGAFDDLDLAMSFISLVVRFLHHVEAGQVIDEQTNQVIFTCQRQSEIEMDKRHQVREAPADYSQLVMTGFDVKAHPKRKRKVEATLARLRQLHDELNAQLYTHPTERPSIRSPADAADILMVFIGNLDHEELWVVNLDTRNRVMSLVQLYKGSVNSSQVRVAEVFRQAIIDNSPAILLAHNHPSGDVSPSPDDVAVTRGIVQAGKLLDIDCLDHIVVSGGRYVSLKERGLGF